MKTIVLDTDAGYESFQIWWIGLTKSLDLRIDTTDLKDKMVGISREIQGGGRVLREECSLTLTDEERIFLVERVINTPWKTEMIPVVEVAIRMLGDDPPPKDQRIIRV